MDWDTNTRLSSLLYNWVKKSQKMHEKRTLIHQKICCGENYYTLVIKRVFSTAAIKSKGKFLIFVLFVLFLP